jgi:hypothetical protein
MLGTATRNLLFFLCASATLQAGNIVLDFPHGNTPSNGDWLYGTGNSANAVPAAFTSLSYFSNSTGQGWAYEDSTAIYKATSTQQIGTVYFDTAWLNLHPGAGGLFPILQWTAPSAGQWVIAGNWRSHDTSPSGVNVTIYVAGVSEFEKSLPNSLNRETEHGELAAFSITKNLAAGDVVRFAVNFNGAFVNDSTGLQGTITLNAVPEPASVLLAAAGLIGIVALRPRKRTRLQGDMACGKPSCSRC